LPKSLSGRFVLGVVSLVLVLVIAIGSTTYLALRYFLMQRLDQQVGGLANSSTLIVYSTPSPSSSSSAVKSPQQVWLAALRRDGSVLGTAPADNALHPMNLSTGDRQLLVTHLGHPRTVITTDGIRLRVQAFITSFDVTDTNTGEHGSARGVAVVGLSTNDIASTLGQLIALEFAIGAVAVALAAGLTGWGVRVGLRPLHRVTRTAQEVTAELGPDGAGLDRRVPDDGSATEVGQVATSVNTLLGAVESEFAARLRSEDRMRQFLADASHELRTPLTSIRGYAELSRLQHASTDSPDDPMRRIEVEGTRMSRLVEDLLVLARGDQDSLIHNEPVDVDALLTDAGTAARAAHPERDISVTQTGGAVVIGDRDQLLRVLLNLLNNAAVHTDPGGPIQLEGIRGRIDGSPAVALRVIDTGPGLDPVDAAHVFERFWRADKARTRAKGGSGLGMAIVAQIVRSHGGTVTFESSIERGTVVTVTLPVH
jgi:two-component system OmpR family sensor kinase